jgi:hypothetical protein
MSRLARHRTGMLSGRRAPIWYVYGDGLPVQD